MTKEEKVNDMLEYMIEGKQHIYKEKQESWINYIKKSIKKDYIHQKELEKTFLLMKLIDSGEYTMEELVNFLNEDSLPGEIICHVVTNILYYSKEGPAFFREFYKECITSPLEEIIAKIEEENEYYKDVKKMKSQKKI